MSRPSRRRLNPTDLRDIAERLTEVNEILSGKVEFGHPDEERSPGSTNLAGNTATSHPGTILNIDGSWAEAHVEALDTPVTFYHNLNVAVAVAGEPNVRWPIQCYAHDGTGVIDGTPSISCNFEIGDTVATNSIQLRFYCGGARTVGAANPIKASLFFTRAVRMA